MSSFMYFGLGDFGCNTSLEYIKRLVDDHQINLSQPSQGYIGNIKAFMEQPKDDEMLFRGLFYGNEKAINHLMCTPERQILNQNQIMMDKFNKNVGTFHKSQNNYDNEFEEKTLRAIEKCDRLQCANFIHSAYDSFSGLSIKSINQFRDQWCCGYTLNSFALFPNVQSASQIEIYNFGFSINTLTEQTDQVYVYDYEALERQSINLGKHTTRDNYNEIISETMLQMDSSFRFTGSQNGSYLKIGTNLKPFNRINYLVSSFSLLNPNQDIDQQMKNLVLQKNLYFTFNSNCSNEYFTQGFITRDSNQYLDFQKSNMNSDSRVKWTKHNFLHINCKKEHPQLGKTVLFVGSHKNFGTNFVKFSQLFMVSFRKRAFVHYYTLEGAEEADFEEANESILFLNSQYESYGGGNYVSQGEDE